MAVPYPQDTRWFESDLVEHRSEDGIRHPTSDFQKTTSTSDVIWDTWVVDSQSYVSQDGYLVSNPQPSRLQLATSVQTYNAKLTMFFRLPSVITTRVKPRHSHHFRYANPHRARIGTATAQQHAYRV